MLLRTLAIVAYLFDNTYRKLGMPVDHKNNNNNIMEYIQLPEREHSISNYSSKTILLMIHYLLKCIV